ncbi:MAG TPA: 4-phosphoerythronate dehydrogenase [Bacteroidota bacterium]|nr:4-phosphoerythronate dehydrogenase [Bacteroidota bacterium]
MIIAIDMNIPLAASAFGGLGEVRLLETTAVTPEAVRDAGALVIRSETKVGPGLLDGSSVRFVGSATIGTDHCDLNYLRSHGITFTSAPGSNANSVKEYILAALLALARRGGFELRGRTLGVVGVGNVGRRVAAVGRALGMRVLLNDPPRERAEGGEEFLPLDALMEADILTLHVPLTREGKDATFHLFDERRLGAMKPGAILMNTSRGAVAETRALAASLNAGRLLAAVLDVWEGEPRIDADLLRLVTLGTSHIAGYSLDGKVNAVGLVRAALCAWRGQSPSWDPVPEIPPAPTGTVTLCAGETPERSLERAVTAAYDIEQDDRNLRALLEAPPEDRGGAFMRLRTGYRLRREFAATHVVLPGENPGLAGVLSAVGFPPPGVSRA